MLADEFLQPFRAEHREIHDALFSLIAAFQFVVGRGHAGVGRYYRPYDAHRLLRGLAGNGLGILPIFFDGIFYCRRCGSMASQCRCPHPAEQHLTLSGTEVRRRMREGLPLAEEFTRPEVAAALAHAYRGPGGARHA